MAINWNDDAYAKVSKLNIGGVDYYIKDAAARAEIEKLSSATKFLGVTTTEISDGSTTNPITIGGDAVTAETGNIVLYGTKEFIWANAAWQEFGDASINNLGELAYNDEASGNYTPAGSISVSGSFIGSEATIEVTGKTTGSISIVASSASGNYTPAGDVSVELNTTPIDVIGSATQGTLPTFSTSLLTASASAISGDTTSTYAIVFSLADNGFSAGTLPSFTKSSALSAVAVSSATFSGQKAEIGFTGSDATFSGSYTPELASTPTYTFVGSSATITVVGSQSKPTT